MYDYYLKLAMPDGLYPALNDSSWGDCRGPLREGVSRFPQRADWRYVGSIGKEGELPTLTSVAFPYAGWAVQRSGWGAQDAYLHFDYGPYGAGHQHEDKLSVLVHAYGRRLLTEGGVYAYDSSAWRRYVLSTRAHNTIMVDGLEQRRAGLRETYVTKEALPNRWLSTPQFDFAEGWYDEGYGANRDRTVTHRRAVLFVKPEYWLVVDRLTPADAAPHRYEAIFHFDGENAETGTSPLLARSTDPKQPNLAIVALHSAEVSVEIIKGQEQPAVQGWVPARGYEVRPVATPVFRTEGAGERLLPWLLLPLRSEQELPLKAVSARVAEGVAEFTVDFSDGRRHVLRIPQATPAVGTTGGLYWSAVADGKVTAEIRLAD